MVINLWRYDFCYHPTDKIFSIVILNHNLQGLSWWLLQWYFADFERFLKHQWNIDTNLPRLRVRYLKFTKSCWNEIRFNTCKQVFRMIGVHHFLLFQINCVVMKGLNEDELLPFVELTKEKVNSICFKMIAKK